MTLGDLIDAGRDLLLAETCVACQRSAVRGLCADCGASLVPRPMRVHPLRPPRGFPPTVAAGPYTAVLRSVVLGHKEQGQQSLAAPLGVVLAAAVESALQPLTPRVGRPMVLLVPAPSQKTTLRARGHDSVAAIARQCARVLGPPVRTRRVLGHVRSVADQSGLDAGQRRANLAGALRVRRPHAIDAAGVVVVVDDLCSTGATMAAASDAVRATGFAGPVVGAVVAAPVLGRARRKDGQ